jgi:hydrogenase maturation protease
MNPVLVIACGNPLRSDDVIGWRIVETLRNQANDARISVQTVQQLTPEMAEEIAQAETVIFVDATQSSLPGAVEIRRLEETPAAPRFTHSLTPATLLALARSLYSRVPREAFLLTVGAARFDFSEKVSEEIEHGVAKAVEAIRLMIEAALERAAVRY